MISNYSIRKFSVLLVLVFTFCTSQAQYTEVKNVLRDSVFTPLAIGANAAMPVKLNVIPANYYTSKFGFFCAQELKIEKAISIPFKFRVGSVSEVDRMEGKPNTKFSKQ